MKHETLKKIPLKVLCLEDSPRAVEIIRDLLTEAGYVLSMDCTAEKDEFTSFLRSHSYDVILSDFNLPGFNAFGALASSIDICPDVPFICVSGTIGEETAIDLIKLGAVDYVLKDRMARLPIAIQRALEVAKGKKSRRQIEETLRESEERYRALVTFSPDAIGVHVDGRIKLANPALCQLLGADDPSQLIGKSVFDVVLPEHHDRARERWNLVFGGQPAPLSETKFIRLDGTVVDVEVQAVGIDWQGSRGVQVIARDITERKRAEEALREKEHHLSESQRLAHVGSWFFTMTGPVSWSEEMYRICGVSPDTFTPTVESLLGLTHPEDRPALQAWGAACEAGERPVDVEFRISMPDGTIRFVRCSGEAVHDVEKKLIYVAGALQDITERKKAERNLRLMAQTVASARDCISVTDLENRFLFVNDAFRNMYGYTTEELLGKDLSIVRLPGTPSSIGEEILRDTLSGGWHGEILNRRKDGSYFPVELWTSVVRDETGTPVAMVGVARNITDRKTAEEHLKQSEEQFRLIAENVADLIAVVDLDGRRIYNSPSYENILGDPESLKGTDSFLEVHPEDRDRVKQVFRETVKTGVGQRIEYRFLRKDGSVREMESKCSLIRDSDGKISRVIVVSRDVTEEKMLAAQFLRAQRMESIGTLAGGIAHDLNNVLSPIMLAIGILRRTTTDAGGQKILNTIEISAKRGADIVKQVLAFGRGVGGDRILVQLKHVINEVAKIAGETFPKSIELNTEVPRDLWMVSADPTQMHQVLLNMLVNARDAMPKGGTLTILAENVDLDENYSRVHLEAVPGVYVSIAITDTGTGIPADIRERIFEPFFTTKEIGMGTGLGLSTTLAIVKSHKGFITLYSELGKGTTFRIYIPATGTASSEAAASEEAVLPRGNGELILVIDDEAAIRVITKETLQAYGYNAITASDGAEGVALFAENKKQIKAVITDIMMPVMDGTAAILALKKISPDVKIIAASGLTTKGQIGSPSDSDVQAFLKKPYTAENLLKTLAAVLR